MSQSISEELKSAEISIVLTNFQGLQYDVNEDTEYEVIASYVNKILSKDRFQTNHKSLPEISIKISIHTADENELSNLFLHSLLLTLIRHDYEKSDIVGYCDINLSTLCSTTCVSIYCSQQFTSTKMNRKISFDVKASTNFPLLTTAYENCLLFTFNSVYNFHNGDEAIDRLLIGINAPYEVFKNAEFKLDPHKLQIGSQTSNGTFNNSQNTPQNNKSDFPMNFSNDLLPSCCEPYECKNFNAIFKSVILTRDASLAFYDHIRKFKTIAMELLINSHEHLFGLIDSEELLHVGRTKIRKVVPLYRFHNEAFKSCSHFDSIFYKPEINLQTKSKRASRKSHNISTEAMISLEDLRALNYKGNQICAVIELELEKPLNEEIFNEVSSHSQETNFCGYFDDKSLINELKHKLVGNKGKCLNQCVNEDFLQIENPILSCMDDLRNKFQGSLDDEAFLCHLTSCIVNSEKIKYNEEQKLFLSDIYKSLGMVDKSEEIFLHAIINNEYSETAWLNYAIFNAKQEEFDKMATCVDELLKINPKSLITNILRVYLLFKSHKYAESQNLLSHLKFIYGEVEELGIMEYVINAMLGSQKNPVSSSSQKNEAIERIYNRVELFWFTTRDDGLLSWQNLFIKSAIFFTKIGCYDIAELCLGEYYQAYGINVNYLYLLAAIDSSRGSFKEALYHLNRISENDVVSHNVNYSKIVESITLNLLHIKNFKKAAEIFNTYIQTKSCDNFLILLLLGSHFNRTNEFVNARDFLIQAANLFHCHVIFQELGKCFVGLNALDLAEKAFLNALQFEINDIDSWMNLREIYKIQDRYDAISFCDYNIQYNNNINNAH